MTATDIFQFEQSTIVKSQPSWLNSAGGAAAIFLAVGTLNTDPDYELSFRSLEGDSFSGSDIETFNARSSEIPPQMLTDEPDMQAFGRIRELSRKSDGWAGPDSVAASVEARKDAERFLNSLISASIALPFIGLDPEGDFSFYWNSEGLIVDVSISGDGTYAFYAKCGGIELECDAYRLSDGVEPRLLRVISG